MWEGKDSPRRPESKGQGEKSDRNGCLQRGENWGIKHVKCGEEKSRIKKGDARWKRENVRKTAKISRGKKKTCPYQKGRRGRKEREWGKRFQGLGSRHLAKAKTDMRNRIRL